MNQLEALKILHKVACQDGISYQELLDQDEDDLELLRYAKRRDQALDIVANMIARRQAPQKPQG